MCGLTTNDGMGWEGMGWGISDRHRHRHHIIAIYMKHDTINNQPTNQRNTMRTTTTTIYSRYTFMMIPPSFEKDNVFFLGGLMEREEKEERERKREERKRELYNVEKMNLEKSTQIFQNFHVSLN